MAMADQGARDDAGVHGLITAASMARMYAHMVNCDLGEDLLLVERDDRIVAYAQVRWRDFVDGTRQFKTICRLNPSQRRQGIGRAMLAWTEARLSAIAASLSDQVARPSTMQATTFGRDAGAAALLEGSGWTRAGHDHEMVRPTLDDIPSFPLPAGLAVRSVGVAEASGRRIRDAQAEAFRDHRAVPEGDEDWLTFLADPNHNPSLWVIAFDGKEIAAGVLSLIDSEENAHRRRERAYLASVFTRRRWRRRGLARALVARALVRLRDHGMTSAYLGVDGLNPNHAVTLYNSLGFEIQSTSIGWTKPLPVASVAGTTEEAAR